MVFGRRFAQIGTLGLQILLDVLLIERLGASSGFALGRDSRSRRNGLFSSRRRGHGIGAVVSGDDRRRLSSTVVGVLRDGAAAEMLLMRCRGRSAARVLVVAGRRREVAAAARRSHAVIDRAVVFVLADHVRFEWDHG